MTRFLKTMRERGHYYDATPTTNEDWHHLITLQPNIPQDFNSLIHHIEMLHGNANHQGHCGHSIAQHISKGLLNPELTDVHINDIDAHFHEALIDLPDSVESTYFHVEYSTMGDGAVTEEVAQATADVLDNHYLLYKGLFGKAPHQTSIVNGKEKVEIRKLSGVDGYVSRNGPINLNSGSMNNDNNRPWTTAHELFHTIEFAFGLDAPGHDNEGWFVEGGANWAATFALNGVVDGYWGDFTNYQSKSVFSESYQAFPLWVFLDGFQSQSITHQSTTWAMKTFLETYETSGNSILSLLKVLRIAGDNITMIISVPVLILRYNASKAVTEWRSAGSGYNRSGIMPFMVNMTNYNSGSANPPPSIPYTGEGTLVAVNAPISFNDKTLTAGAANLYKLNLTSRQFNGMSVKLTLSKAIGQPVIIASMLLAQDTTGIENAPVLKLDSTKSTKSMNFQLDDNSANILYISVVDGRLGGTTTGDITYSLTIKIQPL